jgi:hypothetical protein
MSARVQRRNPSAIPDLLKRMHAACKKEVAVGYPKGQASAYPDGESVIDVAAKNCFGIGVPQRNFMALATMLIEDDRMISDCAKGIVKAVNANKVAVVEALQKAAGLRGADLVREAINEGGWEPNSPATVARKNSSKPLIDTSHMRNAATYVVRDK